MTTTTTDIVICVYVLVGVVIALYLARAGKDDDIETRRMLMRVTMPTTFDFKWSQIESTPEYQERLRRLSTPHTTVRFTDFTEMGPRPTPPPPPPKPRTLPTAPPGEERIQ